MYKPLQAMNGFQYGTLGDFVPQPHALLRAMGHARQSNSHMLV
jgi:hypothetical protein